MRGTGQLEGEGVKASTGEEFKERDWSINETNSHCGSNILTQTRMRSDPVMKKAKNCHSPIESIDIFGIVVLSSAIGTAPASDTAVESFVMVSMNVNIGGNSSERMLGFTSSDSAPSLGFLDLASNINPLPPNLTTTGLWSGLTGMEPNVG